MGPPPFRAAPLVLVTGKGGVGKTTLAAALALEAARRGERAALVEFGDGEAGRRALGASSGEVEHRVVQFDEALLDAVTGLLDSRTLARLLLGHPGMRRLIRAAPGVSELIKLEAVRALAARPGVGRVVVDLPASGHAVGWLRVAASLARFARVGPFHQLAHRIDALLRDPARTTLVVVTLADRLVLRETRELCAAITAELDRAPDWLVINRMPPDDGEAALAAAQALDPARLPTAELVAALALRRGARDEARAALAEDGARSGAAGPRPIEIPDWPVDPEPAEVLRHLTSQQAQA